MARVVSIGAQDFEALITNNCFYVDKTLFIKEWWESYDIVTLIMRPRRFGKTLNMNMLKRFFSVKYRDQGAVFEGLNIWEEKSSDGEKFPDRNYKYRELQGTYPVLSLSFADVKQTTSDEAIRKIKKNIWELYNQNDFLLKSDLLNEREKEQFQLVKPTMDDVTAQDAIHDLMKLLYRYYKKKVIILLDEYDTPMQEAYIGGYWEELVSFTRALFNSTFKTNPYLERGVLTGITRVSKESMFSDLNNLNVVTTTSDEYASCFGFTEDEVFSAMDEFHLTNKDEVKSWYDGFTMGNVRDIYNPWSIINFLSKKKLDIYWANTSSNNLVSRLVQEGNAELKVQFERLLQRRSIIAELDEEIVFNQLDQGSDAIWSLLLASGYLTVMQVNDDNYELVLTNYEVEKMFYKMVKNWFGKERTVYNGFVRALLCGNLKEMNTFMNRMALSMFSSFDGGNHPSGQTNPERFYHGFVLGLLVDLAGKYQVTSNRESGFGRYDVMLTPLDRENDGIILEFKVYDPEEEGSLEDTVQSALRQIEEKKYEQSLLDGGVPKERIRKYGFAFEGKKVRIG